MPICGICEVDLEFDNTLDMWADEDLVEMKNVGHCPKCGKKYKWRDIYEYSHYTDLEERG